MNKLPKLYSRTKTGAFQEWEIEYGDGWYTVRFGQEGGAIQEKTNKVIPKNIGKANATTPLTQSESEARSRWNKQIDKGYRVDKSNFDEILLPMLAQKLKDHMSKVKFPVFAQPKLNGLRCLARWRNNDIELLSRKGKLYHIEHIKNELRAFLPKDTVLDGELYTHGVRLQSINSFVKRSQEDSKKMQYHVYDMVSSEPFQNRMTELASVVKEYNSIYVVPTYIVSSFEEIYALDAELLELGYEGTMIRLPNMPYEIGHRSHQLLKLKKFIDDEFEVIGAVPNPNSPGECCFTCITKDGKVFDVKPKGTREERIDMYTNHQDYIGKMLTVRYFDLTPDGKPFNGVGICFRLEEDLP